jgi:hypothetical protein
MVNAILVLQLTPQALIPPIFASMIFNYTIEAILPHSTKLEVVPPNHNIYMYKSH